MSRVRTLVVFLAIAAAALLTPVASQSGATGAKKTYVVTFRNTDTGRVVTVGLMTYTPSTHECAIYTVFAPLVGECREAGLKFEASTATPLGPPYFTLDILAARGTGGFAGEATISPELLRMHDLYVEIRRL